MPQLVEIDSEPPDAEVYENGTLLGRTKCQLTGLERGRHTIVVRLAGYEPVVKEIPVKATGIQKIPKLTLSPLPRITVVAAGQSGANPDEESILFLDDERVGPLPVNGRHVSFDKHKLRVERKGHYPWTQEIGFKDRSEHQSFEATLKPHLGYLGVGGKDADDLRGVSIYIDGPNVRFGESESDFGETPIEPRAVPPGRYKVYIGVINAKPVTVEVPLNGTKIVDVKYQYEEQHPEPGVLPVPRWTRLCERRKSGAACAAVGYVHLHGKPRDMERAKKFYRAGCSLEDPQACLGYGYALRLEANLRRSGVNGAGGWTLSDKEIAASNHYVDQACGNLPKACYYKYYYGPLDPTELDRSFESYTTQAYWFDFYTIGAWWPTKSKPIYTDAGVNFNIPLDFLNDYLVASAGLGLRLRSLDQEDVTTATSERVYRVGYGLDLGALWQPLGDDTFFVRGQFRWSGYFNDLISAYGLISTVGGTFGQHQLELGVILETVPSRAATVRTFGDERVLADRVPVWLPCLRYAYQLPL